MIPTRIRCAQCWQQKPRARFISPKTGKLLVNCDTCRDRMGRMSKGLEVEPLPRDPRLDTPGLRVRWIPTSHDRKLGGIPACYVSGSTCPDACALKGAGCYAEQSYQRAHWRRASLIGAPWSELLRHVRALPPGTLWRYAVAGDLPGAGDALDRDRLAELVAANLGGAYGFTFTHKPLSAPEDQRAVRTANDLGFTVNLSADGLADADRKLELGVAPVVAVVPEGTPRFFRTPGGARGVVCPAEVTKGVTCATCRLCANASRTSVVGFVAHGNHARRVSLRVAEENHHGT